MAPWAAREERRDAGGCGSVKNGRHCEKARGKMMLLRPFARQSARGETRLVAAAYFAGSRIQTVLLLVNSRMP